MAIGNEEITSPAKRLTVVKADRWPRGPAGRWRERSGLDVEFWISADGRTLRGGSFGVSTLCPQAPLPDGSPQFTTMLLQAPVPRARVAPDGTFAWAGTVNRNVDAYGRITGKSARGRVQLGLGACTGGSSWRAVRVELNVSRLWTAGSTVSESGPGLVSTGRRSGQVGADDPYLRRPDRRSTSSRRAR